MNDTAAHHERPEDSPADSEDRVFDAIVALLTDSGCRFETRTHEPTYTSEQSAKARGEDLHLGAKAIVAKCDEEFVLFVMPADRKLDSKAVKRALSVRKIRFATRDELHELTGLVPGSVPPFGRPVLPLPLYVDDSLSQNERVAFNAGSLTRSIIMSTDDYLSISGAKRVHVAR